MTVFDALSMLGGLAFFLFGMHLMSNGLERMGGNVLKRTLERSMGSRFRAVLMGAGVTALIQSSSATTVMAVGFVNGGIMTLSQSIGVIMGANIGTTVTAWILSLTGIEGSSLIVQLLKPSSFAPVFAAIGAGLALFGKRERVRTVGSIMCGFALLIYGMNLMSDAVRPLAALPAFGRFMTRFTNPVLGVLMGALVTAIIQSSSASVGILQALSLTGGITFGMAIPLIMGQNIGTCVTALISCIGANNNAKRTAMVHLYFNIAGTVLFMTLFTVLNAIFRFSFLSQPLNPAYIAVIHTAFNVLATLVLLPFADWLGKLATLTVRDKKSKDEELWPLDERFLTMPAFALAQCRNVIGRMAALTTESVRLAIGTLTTYDAKTVDRVLEQEAQIDRLEDRLGTYLVRLGANGLGQKESVTSGMYLHGIGDLERISDHAVNLTETAEEMHDKRIAFSGAAQKEIDVFIAALNEIITLATDAFVYEDEALAKRVEPLEEVIDALQAEIRARHVDRLQQGECTIALGFVLSDVLTNLERIADHCSNLAACLIQTASEAFDMHGYLELVKAADGSEAFHADMRAYSEKYRLPPTEEETAHVD